MNAFHTSENVALPVPSFARSDRFVPVTPRPGGRQRRRFWQKRRFWGFAIGASTIAGACAIAWSRGQQTRIVVINDADERLPALTLMAAGQTHAVPALAAEESHRWLFQAVKSGGAVTLRSVRTDTGVEWIWDGTLPASGGGHRILLHLLPHGGVEPDLQRSLWAGLTSAD